MSANKFPNSFLKPEVLEQFSLRSKVMGRDYSAVNLTPGEINQTFLQTKYFNSAWVILISSVDNLDPKEIPELKDAGLAKNFILSGGTVRWDGTSLIKREGINTSNVTSVTKRNAYSMTTAAGFRAMPGITDFNITSTNRWGTIRKATVKFNVWSLDDLETMDKLYFRPGYHIIMEWGHTWGLGRDGKPFDPLPTIISTYNNFFKRNYSSRSIYDDINKKRKSTFLNYDGFLGLITNFSWSFRADLGYDCSLEIVSRGSILESMTAKTGRPSTDEITVPGEQAAEDIHKVNFLTKSLKILTKISPGGQKNKGEEISVYLKQINTALNALPADDKEYLDIYEDLQNIYWRREREKQVTNPDGSVSKFPENTLSFWSYNKVVQLTDDDAARPEVVVYIPLLVLFHLFNRFLESSSSSTKIPLFNTRQAGAYLSFDSHMTLDPLVAALPFAPLNFKGTEGNGYIFLENPPLVISEENGVKNAFNIYVSERTVSEKLFERLNTEGAAAQMNLYELCQSILASVNTSLGGINELDLDYDENKNEFVLIDRAMSSVYAFQNKDEVTKTPLIVAGLRSIATNFSVVTKISKDLGSMISIASQGDDTSTNMHIGEFKKWNENLIDRFDEPPAGSTTDEVNSKKNTNSIPDTVGQTKRPPNSSPSGNTTPGTTDVLAPPVDTGNFDKKYTKERIEKAVKKKGYKWFDEKNKDYQLNIVGIRSPGNKVTNRFDDYLTVSYKVKGVWTHRGYIITTDPGITGMKKPPHPKGVAILVPGQYVDVYKIDFHNGRSSSYKALCQRGGSVKVYRDNNKDNIYDFDVKSIDIGAKFGINIHRSNPQGSSTNVNDWSEGCQVFKSSTDFSQFMSLCEEHRRLHGNSFTYTLLNSTDIAS